MCFLTASAGAMNDEFIMQVSIGETNVSFADHTNSLTEGNWIGLSGGSSFSLPYPLTFTYNGINSKEITTSSNDVSVYLNVDNFTDHVITYPYDTHQMYTNVSGMNDVTFDFKGSSYFAGDTVDVYLLESSISELEMNVDVLYDKFSNPTVSFSEELNANGDLSYNFGPLDAGTYCIVLMIADDITEENVLLSFTAFEVLDHDLDVSILKDGSTLTVNNHLLGAPSGSYTYNTILVKESEYEADVRVNFNGTTAGLNSSINGYPILSATDIMDLGLPTIDTSYVNENIEGIFSSDDSLVNSTPSTLNTSSTAFDTFQLSSGNYLVITYAMSGGNIMGFDEKMVTLFNEHVELTSDKLSETAEKNTTVDYEIIVWNKKDNARDISLSLVAPDGLITDLGTNSVPLGPNSSTTVPLSIRSEVVGSQIPVIITASSEDDHDSITLKTSFIDPLDASVDSTKKAVHTNNDASYVFNVENVGVVEHTFIISATSNADDSLSVTSLPVPSGTSNSFTYNVSSASTGKYPSEILIEDSVDYSISRTFNVVTDISQEPVYDVSVSSDISSSSIEDGEDAVYNITITNTGNVEDTYDIILVNPMADSAVLDDGSDALLQPGEADVRKLTVSSSPGTYDVTFIAMSQNSSAVSVKTTTKVLERGVILTSDLYNSVSTPYGTLKCTLTVKNTGNSADSFTISAISNGTTDITPLNIVDLESGASENIEVTLNGEDVGLYNSTITVVSDNDASAESSVTLDLRIIEEPVYAFDLSMDSSSKTMERTDDAYFILSIKNTGNRADDYNISSVSPYVSLDKNSLFLEAGGSGDIIMDVSGLPDYDTYSIRVDVTSQESSETIGKAPSITVVPALSISANPASQTVGLGNSSLYRITVTNTGTNVHDYDLSIAQSSSDTTAELVTSTINDLDVGGSATVDMIFNSTISQERSIEALVKAEVSDSPLKNRSVSLTTLYLEDDVFGVSAKADTLLQSISSGKDAIHLMSVKNLGNTRDNFSVTISDGNAISDVSYLLLEPSGVTGDSGTVVLTHTPQSSAGDYSFKVEVASTNARDSVKYTTRVVEVQEDNIIRSYVDPTSSIVDSEVHDSSIYNSFINGSVLNDSEIRDSSIGNSTIESSTIRDMVLIDASIVENKIYYGTITLDDRDYDIDPAKYPDGIYTDELLISSSAAANDLAGVANDSIDVGLEDSDMSVSLGVNSSFVGGEVKVQKTFVPPSDVETSSFSDVGVYVTFEESENIKDVLSHANMSIDYDENALGGVSEDELFIYWYDEDSSEWVPLIGAGEPSFCLDAGRDTVNNILWANVTHFSTYAIGEAEEEEEEVPPEEDSKKSSGSSGGGGGGSGATGEAFENIALKNVKTENIVGGLEISYAFNDEQNAIQYINFSALRNYGRVSTTIEVLKNRSSMVDVSAPGLVYSNLNIWVGKAGFATEDNIADPVIGFRVAKDWLTENGIDENSIALYHHSEGKWNDLNTEKVGEDGSYIYFEAETPGFSPFAIAADVADSVVTDNTGSIEEGSSTLPITEPAGEYMNATASDEGSGFGLKDLIFVLGVFIFFGLMYATYATAKKNEENADIRTDDLPDDMQNTESDVSETASDSTNAEETSDQPAETIPSVEEVSDQPAETIPSVEEVSDQPAETIPTAEEILGHPGEIISPAQENKIRPVDTEQNVKKMKKSRNFSDDTWSTSTTEEYEVQLDDTEQKDEETKEFRNLPDSKW
ncbi:TIGR04279 domain-containing protein [Methanococcoides orientis]|uniref:TIGR04279 domain-containing protein n=1 Tax=Methanococcoides orientis TaxID=2822137 RepID=UPI001E2AEF64|nr:TIGR04279 domain-containing protein [Methanococcoides orientis]UGV40040.1 TIGR04279 domain-containing protein [Methanococcoides orientis]